MPKKSYLPKAGNYQPGEASAFGDRPPHWAIEWNDQQGLNFPAYRTNIRSPYIQDVTPFSAVVRWRVNVPRGMKSFVRAATSINFGEPFAIKVKCINGENKYLMFAERKYGIELVWTDFPCAQWEFRRLEEDCDIAPGSGIPVALFSHAANDYLVYHPRQRGINLQWYKNAKNSTPLEWCIEGSLPHVFLKNITASTKHANSNNCYLSYREREYGINLGWARRPDDGNLVIEKLDLAAEVFLAPQGKPLATGTKYASDDSAIHISEVAWTYQCHQGVDFDNDSPDSSGYWLNSLYDRPIIQFEVRFRGLKPKTVYHYRIICQGVDPEQENGYDAELINLTLAGDAHFITAPGAGSSHPVRFLAMGDLGPGDGKPSFYYDVFDLFHQTARTYSPQLWLPLGDIDNDTDGHPNAYDPFFFGVYNAYHSLHQPGTTSSFLNNPAHTSVPAYHYPPYLGVLSGLPVFPTFGNHDICKKYGAGIRYWEMAYQASFCLPATDEGWSGSAQEFNRQGEGFFYTFRCGNVIFISLGIPMADAPVDASGTLWSEKWGNRQKAALSSYLSNIRSEIEKKDVWVVVYFHDHNFALARTLDRREYADIFLRHGVDLVLAGHQHTFLEEKVSVNGCDYQAVVVGTGGFGDTDAGDQCCRPGFLLVDIQGSILRYWKFDTHDCAEADVTDYLDAGEPLNGREEIAWQVREYCELRKESIGRHTAITQIDLELPIDDQLNPL